MKSCLTCFVNDTVPGVTIGASGQCNVCSYYRSEGGLVELKKSVNVNRLDDLKKVAKTIKTEAKKLGLRYDCVLGASGGFDSTYVIYIAKKLLGLNPLVVKYDNGVCHPMANSNLEKTCTLLGIDLNVYPVIDSERRYLYYSTKALENIGVFFSACFSCHYTIASVVYREALKEGVNYTMTSTNHIEEGFARANHTLMAKSLIKGFFHCRPLKMFKFLFFESLAIFSLVKLKLSFDGVSLRFFKNLVRLHPVKPEAITKINVSDYIAWDWKKIEHTLRSELGWETPRHTKVPYLRFDCHYSAMIDRSFKKLTGLTEHAMLLNWFAQAGLASKSELQDDIAYMNDDKRLEKEIGLVEKEFNYFVKFT
jgi:hypothetical protein